MHGLEWRWPGALTALAFVAVACVSIEVGSPAPPPPTSEATGSPVPVEAVSPGPGPTTAPSALPRSAVRSIGYIALDETLPFAASVSRGVRTEAERLGVPLIECDSEWSRRGSLRCAQVLAEAGVHGIISFQAYPEASVEICEITAAAPTVGVVFEQGPCQVSSLVIDQAESGRLAGAAMGQFASDRWSCEVGVYVSLESDGADPAGPARMQGYRDGYTEHCPMPDASFTLANADRVATAERQVGDLLANLRSDPILVVGLNEDAILGAMSAAASAGREGDLWYSGQLADPSIRQHIACDPQYVASVAQFPEHFGQQLVPALMAALDGETPPPRLRAQLSLVTAENVRELYADTLACDA